MKMIQIIRQAEIRVIHIIIFLILILTIIVSSIALCFYSWLFDAKGYKYETVYTDKSPDGEIMLYIQKTQILEGISNESFFFRTILKSGNNIIAEYEGGCWSPNVLSTEWDTQNSRVTVKLYNDYVYKEQSVTLDYSAKHNTKHVNYYDNMIITKDRIIFFVFLLSISILCTIGYMAYLYCSGYKKFCMQAINEANNKATNIRAMLEKL